MRDYDRSLPRVTVNRGELNQVWTNLLDNAIDALGLGLATARRIVVDRHNGSLTVTSKAGDTTFLVRLPLT